MPKSPEFQLTVSYNGDPDECMKVLAQANTRPALEARLEAAGDRGVVTIEVRNGQGLTLERALNELADLHAKALQWSLVS